MIKNSQRQKGSALIVVIIILVIAIIGVLGFVLWNNFIAPKDQIVNVNKTTNTTAKSQPNVEYKTIKVNGRSFRYPLNENNEKVIIISDDSTPALQISYTPIRNYYADKDIGNDCKSYVAGLVNVNTEKEITDYSYLSRIYNKASLKDALADGTLVQVGNKDLYLGGPFKQNEPCTDIYENKDPELQNILSDVSNIRLSWLKSLVMSETTIQIKELGISITVPDSLKDLTYSYSEINGGKAVSLSTKSMTDSYSGCSSSGNAPPLGSISRVSGTYPKEPNVTNTLGELVKQFSDFYITWSRPQAVCDPSGNVGPGDLLTDFHNSFTTIKEL